MLQAQLLLSTGVSLLGFFITKRLIPLLKPYNIKANLFGYDINKKGKLCGLDSCVADLAANAETCHLSEPA